MDRPDGSDPEKTVIRPRTPDPDKTVIAPRQKTAADKPATAAPPKKTSSPDLPSKPATSRPSVFPMVLFGLAALAFLTATAGLVTVYVMTGGKTEVSDESLNADLVPVEPTAVEEAQPGQPQIPEILPPKIIGLSGDPITIHRSDSISHQLVKLDAASVAGPIGVRGDVYRLSDLLTAADSALTAGLPGSQESYAFFASAGGEENAGNNGTEAGEATDQSGVPNNAADSTAHNIPASTEQIVGDDNTSILVANEDVGVETRRHMDVTKRIDQDSPISKALADLGFAEQGAKQVELAFAEAFQVQSFSKTDAIAVRGFIANPGDSQFTPAQISLYREGKYVGTVALSDKGIYAPGEDPWFGQDVFAQTAQPEATGAKLRLLDSIYAAMMRNSLPTSIAGEIILLLSRAYDLDQSVGDGDKITVLYNSAARDPSTGFGRVLYVRIERSSGNIECYAFQPQPGTQFECVSGDGNGTVTATGGMATPVKGVITAKFGPREDPKTHTTKMNFGVDWAAPAGTAVVAAFDGKVIFADANKGFGNFIKIAHEGDRATGYAHLREFATGIAVGAQVKAGQTVGYVGQTGDAEEPELHFELYQGGQAVDPFGEFQRTIEKGGAVDVLVRRITVIESHNDCNAHNPLSTAVGLGQFIESTWLRIIRDHRPDLAEGRSRAEILALRTVCDIAREMTTALARENAAAIRSRGFTVTPGNLYLAHFLGPGGAIVALAAAPDTPIGQLFGAGVVNANPFLSGHTASWVIEWAARKMNQKAPVETAEAGPAKPLVKYAGNKAFLAMKMAVNTLLQ
jgi:murein DD-endopeptidase MepM/ murein hydrolase activator NlpD